MPDNDHLFPTAAQSRAMRRLRSALDAISASGLTLTVMDAVIYAYPEAALQEAEDRRRGNLYEAQCDLMDLALSIEHRAIRDCGGW